MHTRIAPVSLLLALLSVGAFGCANVSGGRANVASNIRTITSVGDKTLPVVAGTPGDTVVAGAAAPERRPRAGDGRISGRVVDEKGKPVPNAEVRLAVGGASRGKAVRALTDESGAFSLNGLRQGASYTVIAERTVGRALMTGRADTKAPGTGLRITLSADEGSQPRADASSDDSPGRINRVSGRVEDDQDEAEGPSGRPRVNEEDLPPAAEATEVNASEPADDPHPVRKPKPLALPPSTGWRKGAGTPAVAPDQDSAAMDTQAPALAEAPDDLAREESPTPVVPAASARPQKPRPRTPEPKQEPAAPEGKPEELSSLPDLGDPPVTQSEPTPPPIAEARPESPSPEPTPAQPSPIAEAPSTTAAPEPVSEEAAPVTDGPPNLTDLGPIDRTPQPDPTPKTMTWGELTAKSGAQFQAHDAKGSRARPNAAAPASGADSRPAKPEGFEPSLCEYDARKQQLLDFRLPDLQGQPVRFKDLGADLILLDFWGSWCGPCLQAIPHLVSLQEKYGDRVKVVGIAYEEGSKADQVAAIEAARKKLKITYPLLVGGNDGDCPLQAAFHIQAYPTMILLDRQGHILWRDQGAATGTLARLDRVIDAKAKDVIARR